MSPANPPVGPQAPSPQTSSDDTPCSKRAASSFALLRYLDYPLLTAAVLLRDRIESALLVYGINIPQLGVLILLGEKGPLSQIEIAFHLQLDPTQVVRHIDKLEELKLLERQADPKDRRAHRIVITKAGVQARQKAADAAAEAEGNYQFVLSESQRDELHRLLRKLADSGSTLRESDTGQQNAMQRNSNQGNSK